MKNKVSSTRGVGIILIHNKKFLLQLRDNNPNIANPNMWGLIGGGIEAGETPLRAIKRECAEEIGIIPKKIQYAGCSDENGSRFYAYLSDEEEASLVSGEGQAIKLFSCDEVAGLHLTPRVHKFFYEYSGAVKKFINGENIEAEDMGLKA